MGDRDYRSLIQNAISSIGDELDAGVDRAEPDVVHLHEVTRCLRRSYFDRTEPLKEERRGFNELMAGLLQKLGHETEPGEFKIDGIKLRGRAEMIIDDAVMLFRSAGGPIDNPKAEDLLFLNACLWIFEKMDGIIVYVTGNRQESSFSLTKNKKMFEEVIRRVRVFNDLLKEKKVPILEPSEDCTACQYYQRCFVREKIGRSVSIKDLVGLSKS